MFDLSNYTLLWFLAGVLFFVIELISPGFVLMFFGIGAWISAIISWTGISHSLVIQIVIFLVVSILTLVFLRSKFSAWMKGRESGQQPPGDSLTSVKGQKAVTITEIHPNGVDCKVEFNGTKWNAESDEVIEKGTPVEIVERKNLVLKVKAIKNS